MLVLEKGYKTMVFLFLLMATPLCIYSDSYAPSLDSEMTITQTIENDLTHTLVDKSYKKHKKFSYYLYVEDFIQSFIEIPTANVLVDSSTISSTYLAGRAPIYNQKNEKVGTCSASFLCMQNQDGIYTDISNYLSVDNGLIISWFTPTTLINLELDSILHSMVTECIVKASTKIGFNPFYGKTFNMIVSSDDQKIYFKLTQL